MPYRGNTDDSNTHTYDRSLPWLGTGTVIKSAGVKLVYDPKPTLLI